MDPHAAVTNYGQLGTDFEQQPALQIVKATAREPSTAALFNYASMAHNNHFFFKNLVNHGLKDIPDHAQPEPGQLLDPSLVQVDIPPSLKKEIEDYFSSVETLRLEMAATANAMFGPGFVWLVKNAQSKGLKILTTYLAGTPYTAGHWRRQGADMNTAGIEATKEFLERTQAGAGGATERRYAKTSQIAPGGTDVIPLLCLNTWEHVWLRDYGLGADGPGGKRDYVNRWWYCIDWNKVQELSSPGGKNVPKIK
ncbi:Manganese/iron superoxide dismutase [Xylariomycetidae sp. FL2044]|nr:Manganese/iron superoxide dismutase [Xylariomycetidae sp. FL2044]